MGEGKRGKPSSELERLQIFAQLATEYFRMVALFTPGGAPLPINAVPMNSVPMNSAGEERRRWVELFRAVLLRKFIVPDEHVSLKLVVRALRLCNYSADPLLAQGTEEVAKLFTKEMFRDREAFPPAPAADGDNDLFEDVLYGRLLHGDADRFHRSGWADDAVRMATVAAGRFDAERALAKALDVVTYGIANGLLRAPEPESGAESPDSGAPTVEV